MYLYASRVFNAGLLLVKEYFYITVLVHLHMEAHYVNTQIKMTCRLLLKLRMLCVCVSVCVFLVREADVTRLPHQTNKPCKYKGKHVFI